jgi:hypothetical protein
MGLGRDDMGDELYRTIKIKVNQKEGTASLERDAGTSPGEDTEFELVSTMMLKQILESDDDAKKDQIRGLADEEDGVLACSIGTDEFKILPDDEIEAALKASPNPELADLAGGYALDVTEKTDEEEDIALVSTQLLRTMLHDDDKTDAESNKADAESNKADAESNKADGESNKADGEPNKADGEPKEEFKIGGFNPYDTS